MSTSMDYKVEHLLRTRLARQAADMAFGDASGCPQPQLLRLEEILPTATPTPFADSEAAFTYKTFPFEGGKACKIVAFVKLYKYEGRWSRIVVDLCHNPDNGERCEEHFAFGVRWTDEFHIPGCPLGQGLVVRML